MILAGEKCPGPFATQTLPCVEWPWDLGHHLGDTLQGFQTFQSTKQGQVGSRHFLDPGDLLAQYVLGLQDCQEKGTNCAPLGTDSRMLGTLLTFFSFLSSNESKPGKLAE